MYEKLLIDFLNKTKEQGLYRQRIISTDELLNFSNNDYLSLSNCKIIQQAFLYGYKHYKIGSSGSPLISGYHKIHQQVEEEFAKSLNVDSCILFTSGYNANISIAFLLAKIGLSPLISKNLHASFYDGLNAANINYSRFHQLQHIKEKMFDNSMVIMESLFSMSGKRTNLVEMIKITGTGKLIIDEAHSFGILGREGLGLIELQNLSQDNIPLRIIPLGKSFNATGAIVAGKKIWIEALLQCARAYIYSTAISPAFSYGLLKTLDFIRLADDRRKYLYELIGYFRKLALNSGLNWGDCYDPIQHLILGCPFKALDIAKKLQKKGIFCLPVRRPTVTKKDTGLRVILNYRHTKEEIDYFFKCL